MKKILLIVWVMGISSVVCAQSADPDIILQKVDQNMSSKNQVFQSQMTIHGRRNDRVITSKGWTQGADQALTEYVSPAREKGTKMLKLENRLWIYSPSSDRTIQISGHMLRQSVMGSDLSYEDMMEDRTLTELYTPEIADEENLDGRNCWVLLLKAKVEDIPYQSMRVWIDQQRYVPLKEERLAKSGELLKTTTMKDITRIKDRWYPMTIVYKDMLKEGDGTEFKLLEIQFDQEIPEYIFTKAALRK